MLLCNAQGSPKVILRTVVHAAASCAGYETETSHEMLDTDSN